MSRKTANKALPISIGSSLVLNFSLGGVTVERLVATFHTEWYEKEEGECWCSYC